MTDAAEALVGKVRKAQSDALFEWHRVHKLDSESLEGALLFQAAAAIRVVVEACAEAMPTSWLDPILSDEVSPLPEHGRWSCPEIEALIKALAGRLRALAPEEPR